MKYDIILANAPILNGNRGCVALSITTLYIIDRLLKENGMDYTIYLPDSQYHDNQEHFVVVNKKKILFCDIEYPLTSSHKDNIILLTKRILKRQNFFKVFRSADFILDIGQGDSFADIYGRSRFEQIDQIHKLARKFNKKYCLLPQTIGPFVDTEIKSKANESIAKAHLCMVRDKQSYDYVIANIPSQKKVKEYIDVAFFMPYEKIEHEHKYVHVGLNISALIWNGGYTGQNQFGLKDDYKQIIYSIIEYFLKQKDTKIHLVPHVVGPERHLENDYQVSYELWRKYNNHNLVLAPFALDPIEIKSYIAGLDFFMGARMHATIGAFSSGVPVVPMAYSRKFNGLFEVTLDYHFMTDLKVQTKDVVLATIKDAFAKRNELKEIINNRMNTIVKEREQLMYDELRKFFKLATK